MNMKTIVGVAIALTLITQAASAQENAKWPTYYYGDPKLRAVADDVALAVSRSTLLRSRYSPSASLLILSGELVSGPDYCFAVMRITAQSTEPPFRFRSSAGSSHEIFHGVPGACPGDHDRTAGRLAIEEFLSSLRDDARDSVPGR